MLRFVAELARVVVIKSIELQSESNSFGPLLGLLFCPKVNRKLSVVERFLSC